MLKNYIKIAWRNISRHKMNTVINVSGLALGMSCCLFIFLWVKDEMSIDNFQANDRDLYSMYQVTDAAGKQTGSYSVNTVFVNGSAVFLMEDIKKTVPEVKDVAFYKTGYELPWGHAETFEYGEKKIKLEGSRATNSFFKILNFPLLAGNRENLLGDVSSIVISRKMAELIFGNATKALGKVIRYENRLNFKVTGVFENLPAESSMRFDFLLNWTAQGKGLLEYASNGYQTFVQLAVNADPRNTAAKISKFLDDRTEKIKGVTITAGLQPFGEKYLHDIFVNGRPIAGRIEYVQIFSAVAIFILLIACINFMNLATARSVKRAKEVGLRKVVGSSRGNLVLQFFSEAVIFACIAMVLSVLLLYIFLPAFNHFTAKHIVVPASKTAFWASLLAIVLITGLVAGSYPALYLSSLKPVRILKGAVRFSRSAILFRKSLTVFQFMLSIILIIATIVITRQVDYIQNTHLGYSRDNLVYVRIEGNLTHGNNYLSFKERASKMQGIDLIDRTTEEPHEMDFEVKEPINWEGKDKNSEVGFKPASVGFDFLKMMKMEIAEGRDFSPLIATDSSDAFMVNEEAVKEMGLKNPIGKWVSAWKKRGHIIAVLKDYHTASLREPIKPVILDVKEYEDFGVILARTKAGMTKEALANLEKVYKELNPAYPFAYQFADEKYTKMYAGEMVISKLSVLFAGIAIVISCMGLLGLVLFAAEQRVKEIGIRKVVGASLLQIMGLFSGDFLKLVILAFLIAAPLSWLLMNSWLQDFAYRIELSWWFFFIAGLSSVAIVVITISYQAYTAARANPVKSLRSE